MARHADTDSLNEHYADYYDGTSQWREIGAIEKSKSVIELLRDTPATFVDIGCGDGTVIAALQQHLPTTRFAGLEVSPSAIKAAESNSYSGDVSFAVYDGRTIDAADNAYDIALLSHVVEHLAEPRSLIVEAARVARQVIVEVPLELHLRTPRYEWDDVGHINIYNRRSIRHLIESCGLHVERERVYSPSLTALAFSQGQVGTLKWAAKMAALRVGVGEAIFTYHYAAIAR